MNVVLLDEQLRPVLTNDGNNSFFMQVPAESQFNNNLYPNNNTYSLMIPANRPITQNGYLFVYVSNEDQNINVYFDNLQVSQVRGPLLETDDYYPVGLKMMGICSKASPAMQNKYQYQGKYSEFQDELSYNQFRARNYDPQIGRWVTTDPANQFASPYAGMGNNWPNGVDPLGQKFWSNDLKEATAVILTIASTVIVAADIAAPSWVTKAFGGPFATSVVVGASEGVLQNVLSAGINNLEDPSKKQFWTTDEMFTASVTGAINGAFQSKAVQNMFDNFWSGKFSVTLPPSIKNWLQGVTSNVIGAGISTWIKDGVMGNMSNIGGDELVSFASNAAGQITHQLIQGDDNGGKRWPTFKSNFGNAFVQQLTSDLLTNADSFDNNRSFLNQSTSSFLESAFEGWGNDLLFPDKYFGGN